MKIHDYQCFAFHDVDLIPENDKNIYNCPKQPRHMSVAVDKFKYRLPYTAIFGGVSSLTKEQFQKVNGFPNRYFGWGGEDDDMWNRIHNAGYKVIRYAMDIARYKMIKHGTETGNKANPGRFKMLKDSKKRKRSYGDMSVVKYSLEHKTDNSTWPWRINSTGLNVYIIDEIDNLHRWQFSGKNRYTFDKLYHWVQNGGRGKPSTCYPRHRVAIIIPYRNRESHLRTFLYNIHPILNRQELDYGIYVVEQNGGSKFNRAMLMNIGYAEAMKIHDYQCFVFHDVDLIPENDKNIYNCPKQPRHMSVAVDKFKYRLPYNSIFGGVSSLTKEQFQKVNGFPNRYFGWGCEDDDMWRRIKNAGYKVIRYAREIARYKMIKHGTDTGNKANPGRFKMLKDSKKYFKTDGINSLKYKVLKIEFNHLYTRVVVDIDEKEVMAETYINLCGHEANALMHSEIFQNLTLSSGQSLEDFYCQIYEKGKLLAKPEHEMLSKFISGLPDQMSFFVRAGMPPDMQNALASAKMTEAYGYRKHDDSVNAAGFFKNKSRDNRRTADDRNSGLSDLREQIRELSEFVNAQKEMKYDKISPDLESPAAASSEISEMKDQIQTLTSLLSGMNV
ncbi:beta-1,4-galactosyltransferase 1 [Mytilus galloprovincialis]|uniref:Beta-1,4-galactosyltransferase 1 n=1 Tax=Mytilus galloprovincialis TaxID=29158 RepID=A0A8B6EX30_MYTGA|nr:beta-1,4-galactosyltransferase 1 [Mytilus galloprovincialis]